MMMRRMGLMVAACLFVKGLSCFAGEESPATITSKDTTPWTAGRLDLGLRYVYVSLKDDNRGIGEGRNFLGSINKLEEDQNDYPFPYVSYLVCRYFAVVLSYDELRAKTITKEDGHTDGTYEMTGPTLSGAFRMELCSRATALIEAGVAFYSGDFDHDPVWRSVGNDRLMVIDDANGAFVSAGVDVALCKDWSAELAWRYMDLDVGDKYYLNGELRSSETIPLDNSGISLTIKHAM